MSVDQGVDWSMFGNVDDDLSMLADDANGFATLAEVAGDLSMFADVEDDATMSVDAFT